MYAVDDLTHADKATAYAELEKSLRALLGGEPDFIACAANTAALLYWSLPELNWAGFYLVEGASGDLVLGPFQGKPACVRIAIGKGVCGTAAARRETVVVRDVHAFPGHIACDSASNSEIVVPIVDGERLVDRPCRRAGRPRCGPDRLGRGEVARLPDPARPLTRGPSRRRASPCRTAPPGS